MFKEPGNELATHVCILPYMQEAVKQTRTTIYPHFVLLLCLVCNLYNGRGTHFNTLQQQSNQQTSVNKNLAYACYSPSFFLLPDRKLFRTCFGFLWQERASPTNTCHTKPLTVNKWAFNVWSRNSFCRMTMPVERLQFNLKSLGVYLCTHWWRAQRKKKKLMTPATLMLTCQQWSYVHLLQTNTVFAKSIMLTAY